MNKVLRIWFWWSYWCRLKPPRFNRSIWFIEINGFALQQIDLKRLQSSFFFMYRSDCTKVQRGDALSNEHKISMTKSRYFRLKYEWKGSNDGRKKNFAEKVIVSLLYFQLVFFILSYILSTFSSVNCSIGQQNVCICKKFGTFVTISSRISIVWIKYTFVCQNIQLSDGSKVP